MIMVKEDRGEKNKRRGLRRGKRGEREKRKGEERRGGDYLWSWWWPNTEVCQQLMIMIPKYFRKPGFCCYKAAHIRYCGSNERMPNRILSQTLSNLSFIQFSSVQFSSVTQSCLTPCDPMNHSTPGLPVHHQLPEFTQTHVHQVGDAIQTSHPLSSPSPPAPNLSQHQGLF